MRQPPVRQDVHVLKRWFGDVEKCTVAISWSTHRKVFQQRLFIFSLFVLCRFVPNFILCFSLEKRYFFVCAVDCLFGYKLITSDHYEKVYCLKNIFLMEFFWGKNIFSSVDKDCKTWDTLAFFMKCHFCWIVLTI